MKETQLCYFRKLAESGNQDPWGLAYRVASGRSRPSANVINGTKFATGYAGTLDEAMHGLVTALCPDDDPSRDTDVHRQMRTSARIIPDGQPAGPPTREHLWTIIRSMPNTAPGLDGITARMVRHVWAAASVEIHMVYSKCVNEGVFPDVWKNGRLIVLPKGNDRELNDPKAYRPITLLSVLGKILERIILHCAPQIPLGISDCQHGFTRGKSTVTALNYILSTARASTAKYVQAVFLDISGAFDNAWWPMILDKVKRSGVPPNIYMMLSDYFSGRRVGLFIGGEVLWKESTMGCPQGSVLGPTLWNVLLDDLLRSQMPEGVSIVAYADDVTVLIESQSRAAIETAAAEAMRTVFDWGVQNRLGFSAAKSSTMTIRGRFQRPPVIRLGGDSIRSVASVTVLGVVIDSGLLFHRHAQSIVDRAAKCFGKMSRVSASSWGIRFTGLRVLYYGTFVATIVYACACWYERLRVQSIRGTLLKGQRRALVLLTKAYRSTSSAALPVLAGVLPADLEVERAGRTEVARRDAAKEEMGK